MRLGRRQGAQRAAARVLSPDDSYRLDDPGDRVVVVSGTARNTELRQLAAVRLLSTGGTGSRPAADRLWVPVHDEAADASRWLVVCPAASPRKFPEARPFQPLLMRDEERAVQLRELARRLQAIPPSPNRDTLLERTRLRLVEIETQLELDPPTSHPALPWQSDAPRLNRPLRKWGNWSP